MRPAPAALPWSIAYRAEKIRARAWSLNRAERDPLSRANAEPGLPSPRELLRAVGRGWGGGESLRKRSSPPPRRLRRRPSPPLRGGRVTSGVASLRFIRRRERYASFCAPHVPQTRRNSFPHQTFSWRREGQE